MQNIGRIDVYHFTYNAIHMFGVTCNCPFLKEKLKSTPPLMFSWKIWNYLQVTLKHLNVSINAAPDWLSWFYLRILPCCASARQISDPADAPAGEEDLSPEERRVRERKLKKILKKKMKAEGLVPPKNKESTPPAASQQALDYLTWWETRLRIKRFQIMWWEYQIFELTLVVIDLFDWCPLEPKKKKKKNTV